MKVVIHDEQKKHFPRYFLSSGTLTPNPEQPARIDALYKGAINAGLEAETPDDYGLASIASVHSPEYIKFIKTIYPRWKEINQASEEVIPNIHPDSRHVGYPKSAVGQVGYHVSDTSCPISTDTFTSARWSANTAIHAANLLLKGKPSAYALCRPPGHHAFHDLAGGFCYFNNSAIAAQKFCQAGLRPAIIDVDLHHGNGTQNIFYPRNDVLTVSVHADPVHYYPFFWGHAEERGIDAGKGYNLNLPIARGTSDEGFLCALDEGLERVSLFSADVLIIALGLDAFEGDPFGGLSITTRGFERIAQRCANMNLPTLIVQEGGYLCPELSENLTSFLDGFNSIHQGVLGISPTKTTIKL